MKIEIAEVDVAPLPMAAICEYTPWPDLGETITRLYNRLYALLPPSRILPGGHNICVYQAPGDSGADLEVGVQVGEVFDVPESSEMYCTTTPGGRVAHVTYFGPYSRLTDVHRGIEDWCKANEREPEGTRWEVFGQMSDDQSRNRVDVYWLLA